MALQLSGTDPDTQAPLAYHQITRVEIDYLATQTRIWIASYVSQALATSGAQPVRRRVITLASASPTLLSALYTAIGSQFPGAQTVSDTATVG